MKFLSELGRGELEGKKVLVRIDVNSSVKDGLLCDTTRLDESLPTIKFLKENGARVILLAHLGRPEGKVVPELTLLSAKNTFDKVTDLDVNFCNSWDFGEVEQKVNSLKDSEVLLLENTRFLPGEETNDPELGKKLSSLADIFVLDSFGVAHREHASTVGPINYISSYLGLLVEKEIKGLSRLLDDTKKPYICIIGGAKIETKLPVIKSLVKACGEVLVGGAIFNNVLLSEGYEVGASLVNKDFLKEASYLRENPNVVLPIDVVVGDKEGRDTKVVQINDNKKLCEENEAVFDIGPETVKLFKTKIDSAKTLVTNGAMGYMESESYRSTYKINEFAAQRATQKNCYAVAGGGETLLSLSNQGLQKNFDLISTGGGAMLKYLEDGSLVAIRKILES